MNEKTLNLLNDIVHKDETYNKSLKEAFDNLEDEKKIFDTNEEYQEALIQEYKEN